MNKLRNWLIILTHHQRVVNESNVVAVRFNVHDVNIGQRTVKQNDQS